MKSLTRFIGLVSVFAIASSAFAAPFDLNWSLQDSGDITTPYAMSIPGSQYGYGDFYLLGVGTNGSDYEPRVVNAGDEIQWNGSTLSVQSVPEGSIIGLSADISALYTGLATSSSAIASLTSTVLGLGGIGGVGSQAQVNWNATSSSDVSFILNKPSLASVATTGSYFSLSNLPASTTPVQRAMVMTDSSGNATWTYPIAYTASTTPVVSAVVEDATGALSNVQITAKSNTSVSIHAMKVTSALGILSLAANTSVPVDMMVIAQ